LFLWIFDFQNDALGKNNRRALIPLYLQNKISKVCDKKSDV